MLDEVKLRLFDLQHIHKFLRADIAGIEQEVMGRNRKQRLRVLTNAADEEVLNILRGQDEAKIIDESFFLTRLDALRIYSMAVGLVRNRYSSSIAATELPFVRRVWFI